MVSVLGDMARARDRSRLGKAIYDTRTAAGISQGDLADAIEVAQPRISDWEAGQPEVERALDVLAAIEEACERPRGHILKRAGYVEDITDARTAIIDDPLLDAAAREAVLGVYEVFLRRSYPSANAEHIPAR